MANFRFELNRAGVRELLQSAEMSKLMDEEATSILNRLPEGYGKSTGMTSQRAKAHVGTRTHEAANENKKNNTLLKALW